MRVRYQIVSNTGRVLGAWVSNFLLFLTGYIAYLAPLIVVYVGWSAYAERSSEASHTADLQPWLDGLTRISGLVLFIL